MKQCDVCQLKQRDNNQYCIRCGIEFLTAKKTPIPIDILQDLKTKFMPTLALHTAEALHNPSEGASVNAKLRPKAPYAPDLEKLEKFIADGEKWQKLASSFSLKAWLVSLIVLVAVYFVLKVHVLIFAGVAVVYLFVMWIVIHNLKFIAANRQRSKHGIELDFEPILRNGFYTCLASSKDQFGNNHCIHCGCTNFYKQGGYNSSVKTYHCAQCKEYLYTID